MHFAITSGARAQDGDADPLDSLAAREEAATRAAVDKVAASVVQIRTIGGLDAVGDTILADGPTTGLVISADGYIISSAFNFAQRPASILVTLASGKQAPAELVATDHSRMLVLLRIRNVSDLPVPTFAPVNEIRVGQWAVAVGRTFRADRANVSVGIVSAVGRMLGKAVQTDAATSTANYGGPLVDIRGRVLGVLVPMSPQSTSEVAGVEWYDSGIGFAVPLAAVGEAIERMKHGDDQYAGLLGISLAGRQPLTSPADLAAVRPDSPAGKAGLKKGDRIVKIDDRAIKTQTDLRLALGPHYAGESVRVVAKRGDDQVERTITLIDKLPAFRHAFLGVLPMRIANEQSAGSGEPAADSGEKQTKGGDEKVVEPADPDAPPKGVIVRMVYAGSPSAEAGIRAGDRIDQINAAKIVNVSSAIAEMNNVAPGDQVAVRVLRGDETLDLKLITARLPMSVPTELPTAYDTSPADEAAAAPAAGETRDVKLAAFEQKCKVYVPPSHSLARAPGLLLWLHAPGESKPEDVIGQWQPICDRDGLVLVVPTAANVKQWERTELEYLRRLVDRVVRQYKPDPRRVVVYGRGGGGGMAYLLGLASRDVFTGIAATDAPLPRQIRVPDSDQSQRLAVLSGLPNEAAAALPIAQGLKKLSDAGYPISTLTTLDAAGRLTEGEREELARWIDTLDRF